MDESFPLGFAWNKRDFYVQNIDRFWTKKIILQLRIWEKICLIENRMWAFILSLIVQVKLCK